LLSLTNDATTVDLNKYLDNTDSQNLSITNHSLSISGGNTIDLSVADIQDLSLAADVLSLTNDASTVDLSPYRQILSLTSTSLAISGGNSIDISSIDTDDQTLSLTGTNLAISEGNTVDLVSLKDNLGNHTATTNIQLGSHWLSNDGTAKGISISSLGDVSINKKLSVDEDLSAGSNLSVTGDVTIGGVQDASSALTVSSNSKGVLISRMTTAQRNVIVTPATGLMIYNTTTNSFNYYNGTSWDEIGGNDNLGNHQASQNIQLNGHYISNDGDDEGMNINDSGNVGITNTLLVGEDVYIGGAAGIDGSAILGVASTTKGFLPPRMTTVQRQAINSPAKGLIVFDNDLNSIFTYNGTSWEAVGGSDNLGNHIAIQDIQMNNHKITNSGGSEGISIDDIGDVGISGRTFIGKSVLIGSGGLSSSAILELGSTSQGFLPPRMTTAQRQAINSPEKGLMVFDNDLNSLFTYNGTQWVSAEASANTWNVSGNTTIDETTDFIGSVNAADVVVKTQNAEVMRVTKEGRVGIGTAGGTINASAKVQINSTSQGFLPPRMTSTERNAIVNPAIGLVVYDTNKNNLYIYTGIWTEIGVPIGSVQPFMGTTIPDGWMLCDGSTFSGTTYPELQAVLGSTTLPDLRGVFLRGLDNGRGLDTGRAIRTYQADDLKAHNHTGTTSTNGSHTHTQYRSDGGNGGGALHGYGGDNIGRITISSNAMAAAGNHNHTLNINNTGGTETRPKNVAVNYIIRVK
jgi:microcystin-dependent protein